MAFGFKTKKEKEAFRAGRASGYRAGKASIKPTNSKNTRFSTVKKTGNVTGRLREAGFSVAHSPGTVKNLALDYRDYELQKGYTERPMAYYERKALKILNS